MKSSCPHPHARALATLLAVSLPALLLAVLPGCHREQAPAPARPALRPPTPTMTRDYPLTGAVRAIDKDSGEVVIRHEEIVGFMKAMTMPFSLKGSERAIFDDLHVGDTVEGTLHVTFEGSEVKDYELTDLVVSKPALAAPPPPLAPAPPPSLTLRLRGGQPQLAPAPRRLEPGEPVPGFTMMMQDGRQMSLSDLRGKVVVLTFIYTRCPLPDFCPLMDRKFAALAAAIEAFPERAAHVRLISLSFDPEHDTPDVLARHAQTQGARTPLWSFAVATHDELARIAPALGLTYGPMAQEIIHSLSTAIIGPDGKLDTLWVGSTAKSWTTADALKRVYHLVAAGRP